MTVVTGLSVTRLDLVEQRLAPAGVLGVDERDALAVTNTAVLPPLPPRMTKRLSFTFSTVRLSTDGCGRRLLRLVGDDGDRQAPARTMVPRAVMRFMPGMLTDLVDHSLRVDPLARRAIDRR